MASLFQGGKLGEGLTIWDYKPPRAELVSRFRRQLRVGPVVGELLARLGLEDEDAARRFVNPRLGEIACPFEIPNLQRAARRIERAIEERHRIVICGDYDVDGVTSTALLVDILRRFRVYPSFIVPLRLEEGYGLSRKAVERALDGAEKADLFIALDCGTNSVSEAEHILAAGCDLIVVDHHQSKEVLPEPAILVNPHVAAAEDQSTRTLCTVGLVFKLAHGLLKLRRAAEDPIAHEIKLRDYLDFVSMGTLADLVPLRHENRAFARIGLEVLAKTKRCGLRSLMKVAGVNPSHGVKPIDISFKIGPRINASGRLADAALAVELLLSEDARYSMENSLQLDSFNRERQEIERQMTEEAIKMVEDHQSSNHGLVVFSDDWHPGVVGIVASRVSRTYNRPCVVLGKEGSLAKGSGRSIAGVNLVEVLSGFADRLGSWGGHPMAVGVALPADDVEDFRRYFNEAVKKFIETHSLKKMISISSWLRLEDVDSSLMNELARLEPFGQENPEPLFATRNVVLKQRPSIFKDAHFRFTLKDGRARALQGVAWKMADRMPRVGDPIDIAYRIAWNTFGRRKFLQLELVDWKPAESS